MSWLDEQEALEEKYIKLQTEWVERYDVTTTSVVRLVRDYTDGERGWGGSKPEYDLKYLLQEEYFEIDYIADNYIELYSMSEEALFEVPFFALKVPRKCIKSLSVTEDNYTAFITKQNVRVGVHKTFTWQDIENLKAIKDYLSSLSAVQLRLKFGTLSMDNPANLLDDVLCRDNSLHIKGLIEGYDVTATLDYLYVGCQTVEWGIIDQILEIRKEFNKPA